MPTDEAGAGNPEPDAARAVSGGALPALVVGGGHNGLRAAIELARAGEPVVVLEAGPAPGGAVTSSEATLPGFTHDLGSGFFPQTFASPAFAGIPLEENGVRWVNPPIPMAHPFADGSAIALRRDLGASAADLDALGPGDGAAWTAFVRRLEPHRERLIAALLGRLPPIRAGLALAGGLRRDGIELVRRALAPAAALRGDLFRSDAAAAWVAGSSMHTGLDPYAAGSSAFGLWLNLLGHWYGWPFPAGGAGRIAEAMRRCVESAGGEVRCGVSVERIRITGGRVRGVRLADGSELAADRVLCATSAGVLARLVDPAALPPRVYARLRDWRYGPGIFKADFALDGPVPWTAGVCAEASVVHLGDTLGAIARSLTAARAGDPPVAPAMVIGQHSLHDPTRAPAGKHTLYVYTHVPYEPAVDPEAVGDTIESRIEEFAPGFRRLVLARALHAPQDLERLNPSLVRGDILGGSSEPDQQLILRPAPELARYTTPVRGLYLGSASAHPGGGVHGMPGLGAARAALRSRRRGIR